jgi:hypothetical protein
MPVRKTLVCCSRVACPACQTVHASTRTVDGAQLVPAAQAARRVHVHVLSGLVACCGMPQHLPVIIVGAPHVADIHHVLL